MANSRLNYAIVLRLITDGLKKGSATVISEFRKMHMGVMSLTAALGAGTIGFSNLLSRMIDTAKETSRVNIALKNISGSIGAFADNQKFLIGLSKRYGVEINGLTSGFTKFKAAADISNMSMEDQRRIFESVSRAAVAFGMSAEDQKGVFLALSQMMSKNKVMAEELRLQMAERMPVAIQAMAKAAGVTVGELDNMMKAGKVISSEVLPKFADALNEMIPNVDTDNLNKSLTDLSNTFTELVKNLDIEGAYKGLVDTVNSMLSSLADNTKRVFDAMWVAISVGAGKFVNTLIGGLLIAQARSTDTANRYYEAWRNAYRRVKNTAVDTEKYKRAVDSLERARSKVTTSVMLRHQASLASGWKKAVLTMRASLASLAASLKALFLSNIFTIGIAAMIELGRWIAKAAAEAREFKRLTTDTEEAVGKLTSDQEQQIRNIEYYSGLLAHNEKDVRIGALEKINELLGTQYKYADLYNEAGEANTKIQGDINEAIRNRIQLIQLEARAQNIANRREEIRAKSEEYANKIASLSSGPVVRGFINSVQISNLTRKSAALADEDSKLARMMTDVIESIAKISGNAAAIENPIVGGGGGGDSLDLDALRKKLDEVFQEAFDYFLRNPRPAKKQLDVAVADKGELPETWTTMPRDRSRDWKMSQTEILEADLKEAQEYYDALHNYAAQFSTDMTDELNAAMGNVKSLEEALKIAEVEAAVEDLSRELRRGVYDGAKSAVGNIDGIVSAFERVNEAMSDADASGWERIMAVWEAMTSITDAIVELVDTFQRLAEVQTLLTKAQEAQNKESDNAAASTVENAGKIVAAAETETQGTVDSAKKTIIAKQGEAAANAGAEASKMGPLGWLAIGAAIAAAIAAFASIPKFEKGGIVQGNSPKGDKILARLNSGEMVLNKNQQGTLYGLLNSRSSDVNISGEFKVRGRDLMAAIEKNDKFKQRTK